jgi:hypothetical protein
LGNWSYVDSATYTNTLDFGTPTGIQPVAAFVDSSLPTTALLDGTYRGDGYWVGARIHIMAGDGWIMKNPLVKTYSHASKSIVTDSRNIPNPSKPSDVGAYTIKAGNEYYLSGKKGEMDSQGEWFYEPGQTTPVAHAGRLYFHSSTAPVGVEMKKRAYGMNLSGRSFVNLVNLDFFACTVQTSGGAAMTTNCTLDGLSMKYLNHNRLESGDIGLILGTGCVLRNSELAYSSSTLVLMQGNNVRLINNYLHDMCYVPTFGEGITGSGYGANLNAAYNNLISHNTTMSMMA